MVGNVGKKITKWPAWILGEGRGVVECNCALQFMLVSGRAKRKEETDSISIYSFKELLIVFHWTNSICVPGRFNKEEGAFLLSSLQ